MAKRIPAYKDVLLIAGLLLVCLGIGNWAIGATRAHPYARYLQRHPGPPRASDRSKNELLEPPDDQREQRDVARGKLEFYQLVQSGGRLMVITGALCVLGAMVNLAGLRSENFYLDRRATRPLPSKRTS